MSESEDRPWQLPRGRHGLSREVVQQSQRERLLAAMVQVVAKKGYEATSVADVLEGAGVGRETFYELFEDKEDCFLAAHQLIVEDLLRQGGEAYERPAPWPERVRVAIAALLDWFAANPDLSRVMLIEMATVGPVAQKRFQENFKFVTDRLDEGREQLDSAPDLPNLSTIAAGGVYARIVEEIVRGRTTQLPELLPQLTYEALVPFIGEEAAREEERRAAAQ